jgi:GAF domain
MSSQFGLRSSRLAPAHFPTKEGSVGNPQLVLADHFSRALSILRSAEQDVALDGDSVLKQVAEEIRCFTDAESAVIALRRSSAVVCVARAGTVGPAPGAQLDSRSGISAECLRQARSLRCKDTETDPRVDGEVCRQLGIRSIVVVPIFLGTDVVGLVEAFSSRPSAFDDEHLSRLEQLASLIGQVDSRPPKQPDSSTLPSFAVAKQSVVEPEEALSSRWADAFRLRPHQIAIVVGFLLLDLVAVYWLWR